MARGKKTGGKDFGPGNPGKPEGAVNQRTREWEAFGKVIIEGNLPWMQDHLDTLKASEPEKAFDRLVELMEYFKPKLARTEHTGKVDSEVTVTIKG